MAINQLTIVIGVLAAQLVNWQIARPVPTGITPEAFAASWNVLSGWRWMFAACAVPSLLFFVTSLLVPESPRWLCKAGADGRALRTLARIGGAEYAAAALAEIKGTLVHEDKHVRFAELIEKRVLVVLGLGIFLAVFQQWCGINVIFNYATEIFTQAGFDMNDALTSIVATGVVNLVFVFVALFTVDRLGRRPLMLFGAAGLALIYVAIGYCYHLKGAGTAVAPVWFLVLVLAAIGTYSMSLAPVVWVLISEIFPNRIRGTAMSIAVGCLWIACFILTYTFPILKNLLGVEFNWPQHHRPGTFMPCDVFIEDEDDGARTVWLSEHDPLNRMKGMHGIRLRPDSSLIELRVRLYNRTPLTQTFLWWANVAARVHDQYQAFFPPDVRYVADHAVRAMSSFPLAMNPYYGVDYQNRRGANDLSWYRNIPVPTSYMVCQTQFGFFGGYDFAAGGGFVHVADRHLSPGKKQWTWGNHPFGWAWDRELTDANGPYVELMAGVFTDNQPDFSYLAPYETKTFSQFWWPIQGIGPVQQATRQAALRLVIGDERAIELGLCVSEAVVDGLLVLRRGTEVIVEERFSLKPGEAWTRTGWVFTGENPAELVASVFDGAGNCLLTYQPVDEAALTRERVVATEPAPPAGIASSDELYFTGEHLEQYRHPTSIGRKPCAATMAMPAAISPWAGVPCAPAAWRLPKAISARRWPVSPGGTRTRRPARHTIFSGSP